ncbi:MAG: hypothetical protein HWE22_09770 [Flavobacteriales bacterium]|nr:hypothetical protein [Flavobacteriales bacterium]
MAQVQVYLLGFHFEINLICVLLGAMSVRIIIENFNTTSKIKVSKFVSDKLNLDVKIVLHEMNQLPFSFILDDGDSNEFIREYSSSDMSFHGVELQKEMQEEEIQNELDAINFEKLEIKTVGDDTLIFYKNTNDIMLVENDSLKYRIIELLKQSNPKR